MKKELVAVFILAVIFAGTIANIFAIDRLTDRLLTQISTSEAAAAEADWQQAAQKAEAAVEMWNNLDSYTHIFIRHQEIDSTTESFYSLLREIYNCDAGSAKGAYSALRAHLYSIAGMEHITLGSIF